MMLAPGRRGLSCAILLTLCGACVPGAPGQQKGPPSVVTDEGVPEWAQKLVSDPESPEAKKYASQQTRRAATERELRKLRYQYFLGRGKAARQEGILKLHEYADPAVFPLLVDIFRNDAPEVRLAILDLLADTQTDEGDLTLGWLGVFDKDAELRTAAIDRLKRRVKATGHVPENLGLIVYEGLRSGKDAPMASAAGVANFFDLAEAIPWLIAAQVRGGGAQLGGGGGGGDGGGDLAYILVGRQVAFVSGLTPVVSQGAVAFDPQLSTVTEGTILRVSGAVVIEYHTEVNASLIDLTSRLYEHPTRDLGWNTAAWQKWYSGSFEPFWQKKQEEAAKKSGN